MGSKDVFDAVTERNNSFASENKMERFSKLYQTTLTYVLVVEEMLLDG